MSMIFTQMIVLPQMPAHFKTFQTLPIPRKVLLQKVASRQEMKFGWKHKQEILLHAKSFPE